MISDVPFPRRELGFRELNVPKVIDGKTVFVKMKVSVWRMIPFWITWYIKAPWRDYLSARRNRMHAKEIIVRGVK